MNKNLNQYLLRFVAVVTCASTMLTTVTPYTAYANPVNASDNVYYTEVSGIVTDLTANFKDEKERDCCYSAMMTGVFGEHFNNWDYNRANNDLIYVIDANEPNLLLSEFAAINGRVKYVDFKTGKHYYCSLTKIPLNEDGINEQNYACLKSVYQAAVTLKAQTEGMNVTDKAKVIHDYMVARYTPGSEQDLNAHSAFYMEATGQGICSAYMVMFLLLGRYCGLDVGSVEYWTSSGILHTFDTVMLENGETRCIDVMWDDIENGYAYFMETESANLISHPRMEGMAAGRYAIKLSK